VAAAAAWVDEWVDEWVDRPERRRARWRQRDAPARSLQALFEEIACEEGDGSEGGSAALPAFLCGLVEGLDSADVFEIDARLRRAVVLEQRLEAELGPLLSRVAAQRLYRVRGFPSLERYAAERLGIGPRKCWALLRIERLGRRAPALLRAYRDAGLFAQTGGVPDLEAELAAASDAEAERVRLQTGANPRDMQAAPTGTGSDDADPARLQTGANPRDPEAALQGSADAPGPAAARGLREGGRAALGPGPALG
jgi:hypothetical protein